ncbi:hypothetical protein MRX96_034111 [Rhipicephalus microplus]
MQEEQQQQAHELEDSRRPQDEQQQPIEELRLPSPDNSQQALQTERRQPSAFRERRDRMVDSLLNASRRASAQVASCVNTARKRLSCRNQPSLCRINESAVYGTCVGGAALVVLVALVLIAHAGLRGASSLVSAANGVGEEPHGVEHVPSVQEQPCSTPSCNQVSRTLLLSLSHETSPCANFYEYVCEGWKRRHPLRDDKYQVSVLTEAEREVRKRLMVALETSAIPRRNQSQIDKMVALYRSCVGSLSRGGQSLHDLRAFFQLHNHRWPEPHAPDRPEFFDHLLELDIRWNLGIAFRYRFAPPPADDRTGRRTIVLQPVVPDGAVLEPPTRRAYQSLIATMATLLGGEAKLRGPGGHGGQRGQRARAPARRRHATSCAVDANLHRAARDHVPDVAAAVRQVPPARRHRARTRLRTGGKPAVLQREYTNVLYQPRMLGPLCSTSVAVTLL